MKNILLFILFFILFFKQSYGQGLLNGSDASQSQITFYESFSSATITATSTPPADAQWSYTNTLGAITPSIGAVAGTAGWMGGNDGYDLIATKQALNIPFTGATNDIILWAPVDSIPNSSRAWLRFVLYFESSSLITGITLGVAFDQSPCDFNTTAESGASMAPYSLSYTTTTYGDGSSITNSTQGNYRIVYADLSRYAGQVGRVGVRVTAPTGGVLPEIVTIDNFIIGKRPTNDACSEAYALADGTNGFFYNTLATGLLPRANSPAVSNMGGMTLYLNPTSATTRPGDGFEPASGGGVFSATGSTVENSTWYKFTTPTLATMTACNGGSAPASMQVKLTFNNLSCAAPSASVSADQQVRIFRSAFSCASANTAAVEQQIAATTKANGTNITLSTADAIPLAYNTTYYMVVDGTIGNDCRFKILTETFLNGSATPQSSPCTVLPIELVYFDVKKSNANVDLNWITMSEKNNDFFTVERSVDAVDFETIGIIDGAGNSNSSTEYFLRDNSPFIGMNYYRLKQTDFDGQYTYSAIKSVDFSKNTLSCEYVLNQSLNKLMVEFNENVSGKFNFNLIGANGKKIKGYSKILDGENVVEIDTEDLPNGFYVLNVFSINCTFNKKIVILK
jgi:hypothetical protein